MKTKNEEWKNYIKMAKTRVNKNGYQMDRESIYFNSEQLSESQIQKWSRIVSEIVASDDFIYNPIGQMIDREKFDRMSNETKDKYVLDLSKIYLRLRQKIKNK